MWDKSVIISMLRNEKYKGDCLMQKTYTESFLTKKQIKNRGEVQQYYVKDHHEPIVSDNEQFEKELQDAIARLDKAEKSYKEIIDKQKKNPDAIEIYESLIYIAEKEYNEARDTYEKILSESKMGMKRIQDLGKFINALKGSTDIITGYDSNLMRKTLKIITVCSEGYVDMEFVGNQEVRAEI